jgi:gas vesicle structural protein
MATVQLRPPRDSVAVSTSSRPLEQQITLLELVDRVLNKGVVLTGDITLSVADVDLVYVGLRVLLASAGTLERLEAEAAG